MDNERPYIKLVFDKAMTEVETRAFNAWLVFAGHATCEAKLSSDGTAMYVYEDSDNVLLIVEACEHFANRKPGEI